MNHPEALWLLLLLPIAVLFLVVHYRRGRRSIVSLIGDGESSSYGEVWLTKWFLSTLGLLLFLLGIVGSLVGFPGGKVRVSFNPTSREVVFLLDISRSMMAEDEQPNRLNRAVSIIRNTMERLEGGTFGLVVFKGIGSTVYPLSESRDGLYSLLNVVEPGLLSSKGTNIEDGLRVAISSFPGKVQAERSIVLFSDGERLTGNSSQLLSRMKAEGIQLFVVALGSEEGGTIPLPDGSLLTDSDDTPVVSRLSIERLRAIATRGNGELLEGGGVATRLSSAISEGGGVYNDGYREKETVRFRVYVLLALIGITIYRGATIFRWRKLF